MYWMVFTILLFFFVMVTAYRELFQDGEEVRKLRENIVESPYYDYFE